jgi:hypothetical protein
VSCLTNQSPVLVYTPPTECKNTAVERLGETRCKFTSEFFGRRKRLPLASVSSSYNRPTKEGRRAGEAYTWACSWLFLRRPRQVVCSSYIHRGGVKGECPPSKGERLSKDLSARANRPDAIMQDLQSIPYWLTSMRHPKDSTYIRVGLTMQTSTSTALLCTPRVAHNYLGSSSQKPSSTVQPDFETMPVLRKHPAGHTVRFRDACFFHVCNANEEIFSPGHLTRAITFILRAPTRRSSRSRPVCPPTRLCRIPDTSP